MSQNTISFAVLPMDDFTGHTSNIKLRILVEKDGYLYDNPLIVNNNGYYLFYDKVNSFDNNDSLNSINYTIRIAESDEYFPIEETFNIKDTKESNNKFETNPIIIITLLPKPSYQFPLNATLVRGTVKLTNTLKKTSEIINTDSIDKKFSKLNLLPSNIKITLKEKDIFTFTTKKGDFVFYFNRTRKKHIIEKEQADPNLPKKKFIRMNEIIDNMKERSNFTLIIEDPHYERFERIFDGIKSPK